jgi:membrane-bound lytic murein transglycosylase MltF
MGTRGLWGFRLEGQEKLTYNHWDSYPTGLGDKLQKDLVHALGKIGLTQIKDTVKRIRLVSSKEEVTDLDVKKYSKWLSTNVGTSSDRDWYCLLRGLQGDLMETLEAEIMIDSMQRALPNVRVAAEASLMDWWSKSGGKWEAQYWKDVRSTQLNKKEL